MTMLTYMKKMMDDDGSDLFFSVGAQVGCKVYGELRPITEHKLTKEMVETYAADLMTQEQQQQFEEKPEMNLAVSEPGVGRFRVNIFRQRSNISMVIRAIKTDIPDFRSLNLPPVLLKLIMQKRGLVLFVGGTGSGKSTSLASLIDYRNANSAGHIITIEDPVEFVHPHKKSIINQREVGVDTHSYEDALENTQRQAPDVILIGEIRSAETMEHALAFAETGHLCISTLHANNANQALDRIINFFPEERHKQLFLDLSMNIRGIISQRLIPTIDGKRAAAVEVLLGTPRVCDLIKNGKPDEVKEVMSKSEAQGMQTFDSALYSLYSGGLISMDEALKNADSKNNLRLKITLGNSAVTAPEETPVADSDAPKKSTDKPVTTKSTETQQNPLPQKPSSPPASIAVAGKISLSLSPIDDEDDEMHG